MRRPNSHPRRSWPARCVGRRQPTASTKNASAANATAAEAVAMVKKGVEKHARENGITTVTIELMEELRKKRFGNDAPVFKF